MSANFLHGVETIELAIGPRPIQGVKTAVIGLVGTAPMLDVAAADRTLNTIQLVTNDRDARRYFGAARTGFTIPAALDDIFDQGNGPIVVVVNVLEPGVDVTAVTTELLVVDAVTLTAPLAHGQVSGLVVTDATGAITRLGAAVAAHGTLTSTGVAPSNADTLTIGTRTYTFKTTLTGAAHEVLIGASAAIALSNLKAAINGLTGAGATYTAATLPHAAVTAGTLTETTLAVSAQAGGTAGNALASTKVAVTLSWGGATLTGGLAQDYSLNAADGLITKVGALVTGDKAAYAWLDPSKVLTADLVGGVDGGGNRTGMQAWQDCYNLLGFYPKILIAPGFSTAAGIASELAVLATKLRAIALVDAPIGTTLAQALTGRGPSGAINFNFASERLVLCYPHVQKYDPATDATVLRPLSPFLAGRIGATDQEKGYWWSASNQEILGITGVETRLTSMINDPTSETNLLNGAGIVTLFNSFGSGIRTWGNRSAAWPSVTHPRNFINIRRTADVIHESIEYAMLQFLDEPITDALIDAISESVNMFLRTLVARGALIDGRCFWDKAKNPYTEIALGHLTFDVTFMPPPPLERITFESFIDIKLLQSLTGVVGA